MPRGPNGKWRPCNEGRRKPTPPDAAAAGGVRPARLSPEERSAIAKRASDARWRSRWIPLSSSCC